MMALILTRHPGESIIIDGSIEVKVTAIHGGSVRLSIDAPRDVIVDRKEIHDKRGTPEWKPDE